MKQFNIKTKKAVKYFEDKTGHFNEDGWEKKKKASIEKIQLEFNLINGKINNIYGLRVVNADKDKFDDSFLSDMKKCTDSNFLHLVDYDCDYIFGKEQKLKLELMIRQINGFKSYPLLTSIGEIVGNEKSTKCFDIRGLDEKLEVKAKNMKTKMKYLTIHFNLKIESTQN